MSEQQAELLRESSFSDLADVKRFVAWYEEEGQIVSSWDTTRYDQALAILRASDPPPTTPGE